MKATKHEFAFDYLLEELQVSETHEDFVLAFWCYWCEYVTTNSREYAMVLANASVNRWFMIEFQKLMNEFNFLASNYERNQNTIDEYFKLQVQCVLPLMSIHPQALLVNAKKRQEKPKTIAMPGRPIEMSIINQN